MWETPVAPFWANGGQTGSQVLLSGVPVEKLILRKLAKIKSRQDAL